MSCMIFYRVNSVHADLYMVLFLIQGPAQDYQASYMGVYIGEPGYNGRLLFTHTERYDMKSVTNTTQTQTYTEV